MKDCFAMWKSTRMLVYTAITAALYAGLGIPTRMLLPLIPGFTDARPAVVIPVVCSFLFGPAAAWGAAFGNLIADFFSGTQFGVASVFGFLGNFLLGLIPYKLWRALYKETPDAQTPDRKWPRLLLVGLVASAACGLMIGWGVDLLRLFPFAFTLLGVTITINNTIFTMVLGWPLLKALYGRLKRSRLLYFHVMDDEAMPRHGIAPTLGAVLVLVGSLGGLCVGVAMGAAAVPWAAPFLAALWIGVILL